MGVSRSLLSFSFINLNNHSSTLMGPDLKNLLPEASFLLIAEGTAAQAVMTIGVACRGPLISPCLYGLLVKETNHKDDGGLYA